MNRVEHMHISPRQLKVLFTLARTLSFSRTAELFHVTQPTLTKIVYEIEAEVGVPLFDRTTRSVRLTREGEDTIVRPDPVRGDSRASVLRSGVMSGGQELASACQVRVMERSTSFQLPEG